MGASEHNFKDWYGDLLTLMTWLICKLSGTNRWNNCFAVSSVDTSTSLLLRSKIIWVWMEWRSNESFSPSHTVGKWPLCHWQNMYNLPTQNFVRSVQSIRLFEYDNWKRPQNFIGNTRLVTFCLILERDYNRKKSILPAFTVYTRPQVIIFASQDANM